MFSALLLALLPQSVASPELYISQPPDHANDVLWFSDEATFDPTWGTTQYVNESFVVKAGETLTPTDIVWWGADFKATFSGADKFRFRIFRQNDLGLPQQVVWSAADVPHTKTSTGHASLSFYSWNEMRYAASLVGTPVLIEGAYHIEIYNDTTSTSDGTWGWTGALNDPSVGQDGFGFTSNGGTDYYKSANGGMAFELRGIRAYPLSVDIPSVSIATGGTQVLSMAAGTYRAGDHYLVLGSLSGVTPGTSLGGQHLPLNLDAYTTYTYLNPNSPILTSSFGTFEAQGMASASLKLPAGLDPALVGMQLAHAFVAVKPGIFDVTLVSNPVFLDLLP